MEKKGKINENLLIFAQHNRDIWFIGTHLYAVNVKMETEWKVNQFGWKNLVKEMWGN